MTIQLAKDQAAQEFNYSNWDAFIFLVKEHPTIDAQQKKMWVYDKAMQIYAEAKAKEAYNQGVRDAEESAKILHKELDPKEDVGYVEKELKSWECEYEHIEVSKQSILKLLK